MEHFVKSIIAIIKFLSDYQLVSQPNGLVGVPPGARNEERPLFLLDSTRRVVP